MGANISLSDMGCSWYYNWGENPSSGSQYNGIEYVPMVWKETNANNFKNRVESAKNKGYKYILTFNEPDLQGQCNMSVEDVYSAWQGIDDVTGIRVSSPVTALWPKASTNWFQTFMEKIDVNNDHDADFISIHCYPENYAGYGMAEWFLEEVVDWAWETYHKPIWITEFSTTGSAVSEEATAEFWAGVMPELDKREYVERYAAFCFNYANSKGTGLWNYYTGELSEGGWEYKLHGNPENFTAAVPGEEEDYIIKSERRNTILDDTKMINNITCEDYVNNDNVTATSDSEINNSPASLAIDNSINTRWESQHKVDPVSLTVDLGQIRNIKEVDIVWENASASEYEIQISNDGQVWTTVAKATGTGGRCDMITLKNLVSARYVKMYGISRSTDYGYSIYDLAVYGTEDTKVDETTTGETTTTEERTTRPGLTTEPERPTTDSPENITTTTASHDNNNVETSVADTTMTTTVSESNNEFSGRTKVKTATKKKAARKSKISLKKIKGANKYQIQISKAKKFKAKNILVKKTVKKVKFTIKSKKIKNKTKLYVRARAVKVESGRNYYGEWSKAKKIKIKK